MVVLRWAFLTAGANGRRPVAMDDGAGYRHLTGAMLETSPTADEEVARIANTDRSTAGRRGGTSPRDENWTQHALIDPLRR